MSRHNQATLAIALLCAGCLLPLATSALALEGVEAIEEVWEDSIAAENYVAAIGDVVSQPPQVPEGIRGGVRYEDWSPAHWSWVRGRAEDNASIKRWVHTAWWSNHAYPYYSNFYVMNYNYDYIHIPYNHRYYMSGMCWSPPVIEHFPSQPYDEPPLPEGVGAATVSPVYLTPKEYGRGPGQTLAMEVNIWLTMGLAW